MPAGWSGPPLRVHPKYVSGKRLKVEQIVAEDGTRQDLGLWDSQRDESCDYRRAEDEKLRCLPFGANVDRFSDDRCQLPVARLPAVICAPPYAHEVLPLGTRDQKTRVRQLAGPLTARVVYREVVQNGSVACQPEAVLPGDQVFAVGATIDPSSFVEVIAAQRLEGPELRVAAAYHQFADGAKVRLWLTDSQLGGICQIQTASDGTARCFPMGAGAAAAAVPWDFSDRGCTVPLTSAVPASDWPGFALLRELGDGRAHLYRTRARHQGPVFRKSGPACFETPASPPEAGVRFTYSLAEEIPPSALGRIEPWLAGGGRLRDESTIMAAGALFPRARLGFTFYDSRLDQDCHFVTVGGALRCIPPADGPGLFADDACTNPIYSPWRRPAPSDPAVALVETRRTRYMAVYQQGPRCSPLSANVHEVGVPAPAIFQAGPQGCRAVPGGPNGYFLPGRPVDPALFVKGTVRRE